MDFIYTEHIDINAIELKKMLIEIREEVLKKCRNMDDSRIKFGTGSKITNLYKFYNLAERKEPLLQELFSKIKAIINKNWDSTKKLYLHSWVNIHKKGENLGWHGHNRYEKERCVHGYFCVEAEPSQTIYVVAGQDDMIEVNNKNNCLVMSYSDNRFLHKVTKWERDDCERITIGFNMVPLSPDREIPDPD
jgi:hypothetical protein